MLIVFGVLLVLLGLIFVYFVPGLYISELILSFVPYIILFAFLGLGISIFGLKSKRFGKYIKIMPLFLLLFALIFFLYSKKYNNFYKGTGFEGVMSGENIEGLDILYSNILHTNNNYTGILNEIKEKNPDVIFMVEFTDDHNQELKDVLNENYPYSARTSWSQKYFGNVAFSKYPLINLTHEIDQGAWRYSYFYTKYNKENYYIYLVHASSPISKEHFQMRNKQFSTLIQDFNEHQKNRTEKDKIIILGDFNVSPWSKYYLNLENSFENLENITSRFTIMFSWFYSGLPLIQSHIDHIFMTKNIEISDLEQINIKGSDHKGFFLKGVK